MTLENSAKPEIKNTRKGFVDSFLEGGQKGVKLWALSLLPGAIFGFATIEVLKITGILTLLSRVFAPFMGIFGLPGEAISAWLTSFLALPGGCAAVISLVSSGILDARQVAILIPMMFMVSNQVQYIGRVLAVSKVESRKYIVVCVIGVICSIIDGLLMNWLL